MKYPFVRNFFDEDDTTIMWVMEIVFYIMAIAVILGIYWIIEWFTSRYYESSGKIIDKLHTPESSSIGTGMGMVGGQAAVVVTSQHSSEKWFVMVRDDEDNKVEKVYCSDDFFYNHKIGDKITFRAKVSRFTNKRLNDWRAVEN